MGPLILKIAEFCLGALLALQDAPRLDLGSVSVRIAFIFFPILVAQWFADRKFRDLLHLEVPGWLRIGYLLLTYIVIASILISPTGRTFGFILWLGINLGMLTHAFFYPSHQIFSGFFTAMILCAAHILIQRWYPYFGVRPESILACVDNYQHIRVFSWLGEPSYAALHLSVVAIALAGLNFNRYRGVLLALLLVAMSLTYSKLAYLGMFATAAIWFWKHTDRSLTWRRLAPAAFVPILLWLTLSIYPHRYSPQLVDQNPSAVDLAQLDFEIHKRVANTQKDPAFPLSDRTAALKRGLLAIKSNPWFGVGFAQNQNYINRIFNPYASPGDIPIEGVHHLYLELLIEIGIVGLALFFAFMAAFLWKKWPLPESLALLFTLLVSMQVTQNLNMPGLWFALILTLYQQNGTFFLIQKENP